MRDRLHETGRSSAMYTTTTTLRIWGALFTLQLVFQSVHSATPPITEPIRVTSCTEFQRHIRKCSPQVSLLVTRDLECPESDWGAQGARVFTVKQACTVKGVVLEQERRVPTIHFGFITGGLRVENGGVLRFENLHLNFYHPDMEGQHGVGVPPIFDPRKGSQLLLAGVMVSYDTCAVISNDLQGVDSGSEKGNILETWMNLAENDADGSFYFAVELGLKNEQQGWKLDVCNYGMFCNSAKEDPVSFLSTLQQFSTDVNSERCWEPGPSVKRSNMGALVRSKWVLVGAGVVVALLAIILIAVRMSMKWKVTISMDKTKDQFIQQGASGDDFDLERGSMGGHVRPRDMRVDVLEGSNEKWPAQFPFDASKKPRGDPKPVMRQNPLFMTQDTNSVVEYVVNPYEEEPSGTVPIKRFREYDRQDSAREECISSQEAVAGDHHHYHNQQPDVPPPPIITVPEKRKRVSSVSTLLLQTLDLPTHRSMPSNRSVRSIRSSRRSTIPSGGITPVKGKLALALKDAGVHVQEACVIGRGIFSTVYKGQTYKGAQVAVKITEEEVGQPTRQCLGAYLQSELAHKHLLKVFFMAQGCESRDRRDFSTRQDSAKYSSRSMDWDESGLHPQEGPKNRHVRQGSSLQSCVVMEYCDKGRLLEAMHDELFFHGGPWNMPRMSWILMTGIDVALAMDYLHFEGVVHGNLRAENIFIKTDKSDPRGFICKVGNLSDDYTTAVANPGPVLCPGRADDVMAFGVLMLQLIMPSNMLTELAYGQDMMSALACGKHLKIPSNAPPFYVELLKKCWNTSIEKRPSFGKLVKELKDILIHYYISPHHSVKSSKSSSRSAKVSGREKEARPKHRSRSATARPSRKPSMGGTVLSPQPRTGGTGGTNGTGGTDRSRELPMGGAAKPTTDDVKRVIRDTPRLNSSWTVHKGFDVDFTDTLESW